MKSYRLSILVTLILLCLATGAVSAQDATEQPSAARPPLVPCVAGENVPCVQNVEQPGDLVGTWRSYLRDSSGIHFGYTIYKDDGSVAVASDSQAAPEGIGSVSFANGIATITATNNTLTNCVGNGSYEIRRISVGDQPVALTYHPTDPNSPDICFGRVGGFVQPMISFSGSGKDLPPLDPSIDALAQPLVPCLSLPRPCDMIATKSEDTQGFWKAYFTPVPQGFGFSRVEAAGDMMMVGDTLDTAKDFFPQLGQYSFNGSLFLEGIPNTDDACSAQIAYLRVILLGTQRVALLWSSVQDACVPRKLDFSDALIWVKGL